MALYFFLGSFIPNTDFSQLTRIFNLVEHFQQHRQETDAAGESFSFNRFISEHYTQTNHHQHPNGHCHQKLPLHQFGGFTPDFVAQTIPSITSNELGENNPLLIGMSQWNSYEFVPSVFQPPVTT